MKHLNHIMFLTWSRQMVTSSVPLSPPVLAITDCFVMHLICQLIDMDSSNIFKHLLFHTRALQIKPFQGIAIYLNN